MRLKKASPNVISLASLTMILKTKRSQELSVFKDWRDAMSENAKLWAVDGLAVLSTRG